MKTKLLSLPFLLFSLLFISCKEEISEIKINDPQAKLESLTDSIYFELDGKTYTFNQSRSTGWGNAQVNLDSITDKGHPDSVLYWRDYGIVNSNSDKFTIGFVKRYDKDRMVENGVGVKPTSSLELYKKGAYPYAVDFKRFNTTDGIILSIDLYENFYTSRRLQTYLPEFRRWKTTIGYDCQDDSNFEVINLHKLQTGGYILEAKFNSNFFSFEDKIGEDKLPLIEATKKSVKNGYVRLHVY